MNGAVCGYGDAPVNVFPFVVCKSTQIWSPLCYLLWEPDENALGPGDPGPMEFNDGSNLPDAGPPYAEGIGRLHHKTGGNILALDGHVDFMVFNKFRALSLNDGPGPGGKGLLWWSPFQANGDRPAH